MVQDIIAYAKAPGPWRNTHATRNPRMHTLAQELAGYISNVDPSSPLFLEFLSLPFGSALEAIFTSKSRRV
jgi:hypothetical protein